MHVGVVVSSIEDTLGRMHAVEDFTQVIITDFPPKEMKREDVQLFYHGQKNWFTARFCFIKMGNSEIELIQPVEGESVWKDFLQENGEGIHHLKYEVDSLNDAMEFFRSKGIPCIQYGSAVGKNLGKTWAYFDTTKELGYVIEVLNRQVGEQIHEM
jgi:catechol 2,3-dioxygenase-like lactoylglutathione lyase family enzyme